MKIGLMWVVLAVLAGCATAPETKTKEIQDCEVFCAELGVGMVELGEAASAGEVLARAAEHLQGEDRADVPRAAWERHAALLEVRLAQAAHARVMGGDVAGALGAAVDALDVLVRDAAPAAWDYLSLSFLSAADRLAFERVWNEVPRDRVKTVMLAQLIRVDTGLAVDRAMVAEQVEKVDDLGLLLFFSEMLSRSGDDRTLVAMRVHQKIVPRIQELTDEQGRQLARLRWVGSYIRWSPPSERATIDRLVALQESELTGPSIPIEAYPDREELCAWLGKRPFPLVTRLKSTVDFEALNVAFYCAAKGGNFRELSELSSRFPDEEATAMWGFWAPMVLRRDSPFVALLLGQPVEESRSWVPWEQLRTLRSTDLKKVDAMLAMDDRHLFSIASYRKIRLSERAPEHGKTSTSAMWRGIQKIEELDAALKPLPGHWFYLWKTSFLPGYWASPECDKVGKTSDRNVLRACEVEAGRVTEIDPVLAASADPHERDTAAWMAIRMGNLAEARRIFDTYGVSSANSYLTMQVLEALSGGAVDADGVALAALVWFGNRWAAGEVVRALRSKGRLDEACQVLGAVTQYFPWPMHPEMSCPEVEAAYEAFWGFRAPWTMDSNVAAAVFAARESELKAK